jgi:peroxiredoxin
MQTLRPGERFPTMEAAAVDGSHFRLPEELAGVRAVLVFYRGHW